MLQFLYLNSYQLLIKSCYFYINSLSYVQTNIIRLFGFLFNSITKYIFIFIFSISILAVIYKLVTDEGYTNFKKGTYQLDNLEIIILYPNKISSSYEGSLMLNIINKGNSDLNQIEVALFQEDNSKEQGVIHFNKNIISIEKIKAKETSMQEIKISVPPLDFKEINLIVTTKYELSTKIHEIFPFIPTIPISKEHSEKPLKFESSHLVYLPVFLKKALASVIDILGIMTAIMLSLLAFLQKIPSIRDILSALITGKPSKDIGKQKND